MKSYEDLEDLNIPSTRRRSVRILCVCIMFWSGAVSTSTWASEDGVIEFKENCLINRTKEASDVHLSMAIRKSMLVWISKFVTRPASVSLGQGTLRIGDKTYFVSDVDIRSHKQPRGLNGPLHGSEFDQALEHFKLLYPDRVNSEVRRVFLGGIFADSDDSKDSIGWFVLQDRHQTTQEKQPSFMDIPWDANVSAADMERMNQDSPGCGIDFVINQVK